jgi:hypothetical protein
MTLYRALDPSMLARRARGRDATLNPIAKAQYGARDAALGVANIELLEARRRRPPTALERDGGGDGDEIMTDNDDDEQIDDDSDGVNVRTDDGDDESNDDVDELDDSAVDSEHETGAAAVDAPEDDADDVAHELDMPPERTVAAAVDDTSKQRFDAIHVITFSSIALTRPARN